MRIERNTVFVMQEVAKQAGVLIKRIDKDRAALNNSKEKSNVIEFRPTAY